MADRPLAHSPTLAATRLEGVGQGDRLAAGTACGDYIVERFLGAGAMGEVYAGKHPVIGKKVAIKVLRRDAASSEAAERLVREAQAASHIDHPNVVDVFGLGRTSDGRLYLVMDLVDGQSLRGELAGGPLPPERALAILDQIADALDAAHARGVIHRDLKPDNIMIAGARAYVLDFGLAKLVASAHPDLAPGTLTGQGTWLGTPAYMAPEQWSADGAGPASDRYALGVIAFELLAGTLPFEAGSVPAMMEQHFRAPVPSVSAKGVAPLPDAVDEVLQRALAKDPAARFATAREMIEALRGALGTAVQPARKRGAHAAKRPWLPAAAGAGVLGVGIVAAIAMRPHDDKPAIAPEPAQPVRDDVAIHVTSIPDVAQVVVDGKLAGTTPVDVRVLRATAAQIVVRKPGYVDAHRTLTAASGPEIVQLSPVARFEGVWRQPSGELRAFARVGERVDVSKLDTVAGPRRFYRHYAFELADHGIAFASDEEVVDQRAPDDASCHVPVHVRYTYDPERDVLELARDNVTIDLVDSHCVVRTRESETLPMVRVDDAHETSILHAPVGKPPVKIRPIAKRPPPVQPQRPVQPAPYQPAPNVPNLDQAQQQAPDLTPSQSQQLPRKK